MFTYLWSWALPEKLQIVQPFRNFPTILRNPMVHHRVHKSLALAPILSQFNPVYTIPFYHSKIHFNIVHPPTSWSSWWSLSFWLSHQYPICIPSRPHSCYMPCLSHPLWLDHSNYVWQEVKVMKLLIMQFPPISVTSHLFGPNILLSILFSNTFLNVREQVSHPYRTTGKIIVLYILILDSFSIMIF
jgi:hypothetical protein